MHINQSIDQFLTVARAIMTTIRYAKVLTAQRLPDQYSNDARMSWQTVLKRHCPAV